MNRLVIIGNGFDLAHGLATKYEDFIVEYFRTSIEKALESNEKKYEDELLSVRVNNVTVNDVNWLSHFTSIDYFKKSNYITNHKSKIVSGVYFSGQREKPVPKKNIFDLSIKSDFLRELIDDKNWTDIENFYFLKLLEVYENPHQDPDTLNFEFETITKKIADYIHGVNKSIDPQSVHRNSLGHVIDRAFENIIHNKNQLLFVNFNYTDLLTYYTSFRNQINHLHMNVHGTISYKESIIFGYGDDSHEKYQLLENTLIDEYLQNIKSFRYPESKNYETLINFIENGDFEVYVIGHSLGVSDRVLLKTIFEDPFCKNIRLFHRGNKKSHFKKCISVSRHFSDKVAMRKKIVSFDQRDVLGY
jgi:hypothetical protein